MTATLQRSRRGTKQTEKPITYWNGQYRASIGYEIKGDDGPVHDLQSINELTAEEFIERRKPRVWMLGPDIRIARPYLDAIKLEWRQLKASNPQAVWTAYTVAWVQQTRDGVSEYLKDHDSDEAEFRQLERQPDARVKRVLPAATSTMSTGKRSSHQDARSDSKGTITLAGVVGLYEGKLQQDVQGHDRGRSNADRQKTSVNSILNFIDGNTAMSAIGYDEISKLATALKDRQTSGYAPLTIKTMLQHFSSMLGYAEDAGHWRANCNYERLLKVNVNKLTTLAEQKKKSKGKDLFTVDEIKQLFRKANARQRLWMLLAMNTCCTQQQISDLLPDDLHVDCDKPYIEFIRSKTRTSNNGNGITVRFDFWPELLPLLKAQLRKRTKPAKPEYGDFALLTSEGCPLVRYDSGRTGDLKTDTIRLTFEKLLKTCKASRSTKLTMQPTEGQMRWLPFGTFRKTISSMVRAMAGEPIQQLALAHGSDSVAAKHYTGEVPEELRIIEQQQQKKLDETMMKIHNEVLKPVWEAMAEACSEKEMKIK